MHCILADFKSRLLQVFPVSRVRFGNDLWFIYLYLGQYKAGGGKCHGHTVVFVGGDDGVSVCRAAFAIPQQDAVLLGAHDVTQFTQFRNEGGDTVGLLYFKALQSGEAERDVHQAAGDDKGLRQVRDVHHVFVETGGGSTLPGQFYSPVCIFGMDAEAGKDFRAAAVALIAVGEETEQFDSFNF